MNWRKVGENHEGRAASYFERLGWDLISRNYSCRAGEVDLIFADREGAIIFVEVKFRSRSDYGLGQEFVDFRKQSRMAKAALFYIKQKNLESRNFRFDVAALSPEGLEHIPNAFSPEGYTL